MKRKWFLLLALILAFSVLAMGCAKKDEPAKTEAPAAEGDETEAPEADATDAPDDGGDEPAEPSGEARELKLGVLVPTTGPEAYYGKDMLNSYQMAVDEINEAGGFMGGYTFTLAQEDDACDAAQAATAASKILSGDPDFIVGGYCSGATIPALQQFYDADKIMLISAANSTNITDLNLNQSFMINSPGTHGAQTLMDLAKHLEVTKLATIHQGDDYTKNLSDIVEREAPGQGFEVVTVQVMEKQVLTYRLSSQLSATPVPNWFTGGLPRRRLQRHQAAPSGRL